MRKISTTIIMLFLGITSLLAQTKEVTGKVTDAKDGTPLQGVTIKVKNGAAIGATDENGFFKISIPAKTKTIAFSSVDYSEIELPVSSDEMSVKMDKGNRILSEVIVSGYSSRSKRANTGSASLISIDDVRSQPNASFDQLLQGQAPGLNVKTGSGQPGRSADVVIRGKGSINGSVNPLYILDGIEIRGSDFSSMNQNDFETITILKDAASTAIYGSRGSNGVIVITTKKGKAGKLKINYDFQTGSSKLPKNQLELMNTQEKLDFETNIAGNPWGWTDEEVTNFRQINTNWDDYVFRKGNTQSHQLSLSGGSDKTTFYTSLGYYNEEGITIATGIKKYNARLNISHADNNIKIGANLSAGWSDFTGTSEGNSSIGSPLNTVIWALPYETPFTETGAYTNSVQFPFWLNPVEDLTENKSQSSQLKGSGNVYLEYKLPWIKNLTYKINTGLDYSQFEGFSIIKNGTQNALQNDAFGQAYRGQGEVSRSLDRRFKYTITNSLNYKTFLDKASNHSISVSAYYEFLKNQGRDFNYTGYGLLLPFDNEAGLVAGTIDNGYIPIVGGGFPENSALTSYFGYVDYAFKNRYFLTVTARTDGSSKLSPGNKWTQYGSVGAGWIVSDEKFFNINAINYMKLKASYGNVGNQNGIGEFPYLQQYGKSTYGGAGTLQVNRLRNDNLTWEIRSTANIGVDMELFKNRLRASVEVYKSLTKKLYFSPFVPSTSGGGGNILSNNGSMENKGIEVSLGVKLINSRDFKWSIDLNYAYNKNTIKSLPDNQDLQLYKSFQALKIGKPFNSFYLVPFVGVNPENGNSQYLKADGKTITETYDANDKVVIGTSDAPNNGGVTNTFSYKGIELSAFAVLSWGNYIYNNARLNVENSGYSSSGFAKNGINAWTTPGQITNFPRITETTESQTTRYLEKGDFFRLRNVQLAYTIPKSLISKLKIQGLRFFVQGQNLYTKFKFQGWDPEVSNISSADSNSSADVSGAQYPTLKRVTFGLNVTL
jgi:TonB-dependent starch-binding outer membrane protein SusC